MSSSIARRRARLLALVAAAWLVVPSLASAASVTIDTATKFQTMEGFGTCLPWWINDPSTSPAYSAALRADYVKDLGFNILRVEMHPSALMGSAGTLDSRVDLVDDVATNVSKFDFTRAPVKLYGDFAQYVRDNVLEPGTFRLVGAFWSPPHWLKGPTGTKVDGKATPFLNDAVSNTCGGRLLQDDATKTQFARYVGAWIRGFEKQYGVTWSGVSLQNELIYETSYNSANYGTDQNGKADQWWQYADALKAVSDYFKTKSIVTPIMGPHHASVSGSPQNPWHLYEQMGFIDAVKNHASGNLMDSLGMFASNDYNDGGQANHAVMLRGYWEGTANVPASWAQWAPAGNISQYGKQNWFQETSGEANSWDKDNALGLAQKVHDALVFGHASAYIYWLAIDDQLDVGVQTLLGTNQIATPTASKKYCAMKHFSRYIRPGAQRVKATFDSNGWPAYGGATQDDTYNSLNVSAYQKGNGLTVVFVNMRGSAEPTTISLPASLGLTTLQRWQTTSSDSFAAQADLTVANNQVTLTVPAYSVVTLTGQGGSTPVSYALTVAKAGTGSGTVTSSPSGISCGTTCSASYTSGSLVTLTAAAASGSSFTGWSGACSGTAACTVTMSAAQSVTATFGPVSTSYALTVTKSGTGSGTVAGGPISCGSTCSATVASGTVVTLTATAASGSSFTGWSGACSGTAACTVTMSAARSVTATFSPVTTTYALTVTKSGTGSGTVAGGPISCGSTCSATLASGTLVTLTATAATGSTFSGWTGACSGTAACTVTMSAARAVTATFTLQSTDVPCANAVTLTAGNSGNFNTTGAACFRTAATINGWGCYNMDGRTVSVNGATASTTCGAMPLPAKWSDGYYYFAFTAGTYPWTGWYYW